MTVTRTVVSVLKDAELYASSEKCSSYMRRVAFLGHLVSKEGIGMDMEQDKLDAINTRPSPSDLSKLRGFLGLANLYRRFVK